MNPKNYLEVETIRNRLSADLFGQMVKNAFGCKNDVLVGHHICFEYDGDISTENEIPAADTLIFDHDIMRAEFGEDYIEVMQRLAATPAETRDELLRSLYEAREAA